MKHFIQIPVKKSLHFAHQSPGFFIISLFCIFLMFTCISDISAEEKKADFLFHTPKSYIGFRTGMFFPDADSGVFDMTTRELTLEKSDFNAWTFGMDLGFCLTDRFELIFNLDHSDSSESSEFRDYVDLDNNPITQTTDFKQTPLTAGIKYLFIPRGKKVGEYSWLPSFIVPHVSAGAGWLWYEFSQRGDFVDSSTLDIFSASLDSSGSVPTLYLGCGVDVNIYKSAYLNLDFKYSWAEDDMDQDFVGFDPIDLSGIRLTAGIQWFF